MLRLKRVDMVDGTVYKNLYYGHDWEDLEYYSESDAPTILFYVRKNGKFEELELDTEKITGIELDKEYQNNLFISYDKHYQRAMIKTMEMDEHEYGDEYETIHPKIREVSDFCEDIMIKAVDDYDLDDPIRFMIVDNMVSIVIGYLETVLELDDDDTTPEIAFAQGYVITILAASFACGIIESEKDGYKKLLRNVVDIIPDFTDYVESKKDDIKIVYVNSDEDAQK